MGRTCNIETLNRPPDTSITIHKYTDFDEIKADEYRYWQSRPVHERLNTAAELSIMGYQLKEPTRDVQSRLQRTLVRVERAPG